MTARGPRILFAGGGTGGHIIPALALAEEVVSRGGSVRFVGTADRIEAELVPRAGFGIDFIHVRPLAGGGAWRSLVGVASVPSAVMRSLRVLSRWEPDVVLGVGGYVAGPVVLAGAMRRTPTAFLEQNAALGLTNRILARVVDRAFVSYEATLAELPAGKGEVTGNPVSAAVLEAAKRKPEERRQDDQVHVLVMGGSQGALSIDEKIPKALARSGIANLHVCHQCSPGNEAKVQEAYARVGIEAQAVGFIDDTASAYSWADLVVCRSGATTVAEIATVGLPAVFLPYPHHKDDQQRLNAEPLCRVGAAKIVEDKSGESVIDDLARAVGELGRDPETRRRAGEAARSVGRPEAARRIADILFEMAKVR